MKSFLSTNFMNKDLKINDFKFWRYLINFWSILFFVVIAYDFATNNSCNGILNVLATVYISALALYVSNKEFERWYDKHNGQHPGEVFVFIWSMIIFILIFLSFFNQSYQIPSAVVSSYVAVLTILAVTRKSKQLYLSRHKKR